MEYAINDVTAGTDQSDAPQPLTPLQELKAEFAKAAKNPRLFKRLPAREGRLAAEYAPPPGKDAQAAAENDKWADMLVASLKGILVHDPEHEAAIPRGEPGEGLVPLGIWADQPDLDPLGFDNRLMDLLELPHGNATQVVMSMFEGNEVALAAQANEVGAWAANTSRQDLQDFGRG
jgi:hypothetical protein